MNNEQGLIELVNNTLNNSKIKRAMNNLEYEVYAVFNRETNERYSQWFSRKHDAIKRKQKDFGWCNKEIQDEYYVARVKFTTKDFEVIDD